MAVAGDETTFNWPRSLDREGKQDLSMLFNSLEFFGFLAVVYLAYRLLPFRWQNRMLLVAGFLFYGWWDVRFLFLIACSTTVDFSIGLLPTNTCRHDSD
jgi:hypothetical protein